MRAKFATQLDAIPVWQQQIQEDEIDASKIELGAHGARALSQTHLHAVSFEACADDLAQRRIVADNKASDHGRQFPRQVMVWSVKASAPGLRAPIAA